MRKLWSLSKNIIKNESFFIFFWLFLIFFLGLGIRLKTLNQPHLLTYDPFYWERIARFLLREKIPEYDTLRFHPNPPKLEISFFPRAAISIYKFLNLFLKINFELFLFWFPAFVGTLSIFPMYIIGKELFDKKVGLLASFLFILAPETLSRTMAGTFDTDSFNILFSTLAIAFFLLSFRSAQSKEIKKLTIFAILAGISLSFFALTWNTYWFVFWFLFAFLIFYLFYKIKIIKEDNFKFSLISFLIFTITFLAIIIPSKGISFLKSTLIEGPFKILITRASPGDIFPNVMISVAEKQFLENPLLLIAVTGETILLSGILGFFILIYFFFRSFLKKENFILQFFPVKRNFLLNTFFILSWFFPLFVISFLNKRTIEYLIFPLVLLSSFFIVFLFYSLSLSGVLNYQKNKKIFILAILGILAISGYYLFYPFYLANERATLTKTYIDKDIEGAMEYLATQTSKDTVVISSWDWGYWIESLAKRKTVVDNGGMNEEKITPLENLRGLNCVKDRKGYVENGNCITSRVQDIDITFYTKDEEKAVKILKSYLGDSNQMYYLLSDDLINKSYWWSYFATWDRNRKSGEHFAAFLTGIGKEKIEEILKKEKENLRKEIFFGGAKLIEYENKKENAKGFFWIDSNLEKIFYISEELKDSLAIKLFFFNGGNLRNFELVFNNPRIKIFKINFD